MGEPRDSDLGDRVAALEGELARLKRVVEGVCLPLAVRVAAAPGLGGAANAAGGNATRAEPEAPTLLSRLRDIAADVWHGAEVGGTTQWHRSHVNYVDLCGGGGSGDGSRSGHGSGEHAASEAGATVARTELPPRPANAVRIVACSDTHERHRELGPLPEGDVFVHSGDILWLAKFRTLPSQMDKLANFNEWLRTVPCRERVVVAGNHDDVVEQIGRDRAAAVLNNATYLENTWVDLFCGLRVFGTPCSSKGHKLSPNLAFQSDACASEADDAARACGRADVVVSHGACPRVAAALDPLCHLWGHYHRARGVVVGEATTVDVSPRDTIDDVAARIRAAPKHERAPSAVVTANTCILSFEQQPLNLPVVIDLPRPAPPRPRANAPAAKL